MEKNIYKICPAPEWAAAVDKGRYIGSKDDERDGFIHFSCANQLAGTLAKHFADQEDLVLIHLQADELGEKLKWETSRGGQSFPHLYTTLDTKLAKSAQPIALGTNGHIIPNLES